MLNWAYFAGRKIRNIICWIIGSLKSIDSLVTALATVAIVIVAILQWKTFEKTDTTLKAQQRAWIEPETIKLTGGQRRGEHLSYVLLYRNHGREPGTNVVIQFEHFADKIPKSPPYGWFPGTNQVCNISHPNPGGLVTWPDKANQLNYSLGSSPPESDLIWDGKKTLRIETCIGYETVGEAHYSAACFYTYPIIGKPFNEWPLVPCMNHYFAR